MLRGDSDRALVVHVHADIASLLLGEYGREKVGIAPVFDFESRTRRLALQLWSDTSQDTAEEILRGRSATCGSVFLIHLLKHVGGLGEDLVA